MKILKEWMLPIAMVTGASIYLIYHVMPEPVHRAGPVLENIAAFLQPALIFAMLFLTFCSIEPRDLKPHRWHWWLLLIQGGLFSILGIVAVWVMKRFPESSYTTIVLIESAMLCLICPTATAASVVTRKLGGDVPGITTYIVLVNILTAVLVPVIIPMIQPIADTDFWTAFDMIMVKVFPLLITPCLCAWLVRYLAPKIHSRLMKYPDLAFYLWSVGLTLAIAVTTRSIVHSDMKAGLLLSMSAVSLVCCIVQFTLGRFVGSRYKPDRAHFSKRKANEMEKSMEAVRQRGREIRKVTAGQSLGQKNTIFAIWMGYTFMIPETAIVGGLYSIWHNLYNSWQLYRTGTNR